MSRNQNTYHDNISFSQKYGYETIPEPMRLEYISKDLRVQLCNQICNYINRIDDYSGVMDILYSNNILTGRSAKFVRKIISRCYVIPEMTIAIDSRQVFAYFEKEIIHGKFNSCLDILQIICNHPLSNDDFIQRIRNLFDQYYMRLLVRYVTKAISFSSSCQ